MELRQTLSQILARSSILGDFLKKSEQLLQLNRSVLKLIESDLAPHCQVHSFNHNILVLSTSSSMWGHKLRFKVPDLIANLRQVPQFAALKTINVKVCFDETAVLAPLSVLPCPQLSPKSARVIQSMAKEIKFPKLQQSLLRLSKRQR